MAQLAPILLILVVGLSFRLYGIDWDKGIYAHPDELHIVLVSVDRVHLSGNVGQLLDPDISPLNPRRLAPDGSHLSYSYGTLLVYLLKLASQLAAGALRAPHLATFEGIYLVGRALSAVADTVTVGAIFLISRRLFGRRAGLLAAALSAVTVLQIQYAHYYVAEPLMVMFLTLALHFALASFRGGRLPPWATGVCLGLAVGTKPSAAAFIPPALLIVAAGAARRTGGRTLVGSTLIKARASALALGPVVAGLVLAWAVVEPYAWLDPTTYLANIRTESEIQRGALDYPFTRQYIGTVPGLYHWQQYVRWAVGIPLGVAGSAGAVYALWLGLAKRRPRYLALLVWCAPYVASILVLEAKWLRYLLPLLPVLTILASQVLLKAPRLLTPRSGGRAVVRALGLLPAGAVLVATALWAVAFMRIYTEEHPWIAASRWMAANVPAGASVATEHWDRQLPVDVRGLSPRSYDTISANLYDDLPPEEKLGQISALLRDSDYIVLASQRLSGSIPRSPWRYAVASRYYDLLFAERLGFVKVAEFTSAPTLGSVPIRETGSDESFTVYDHPRATVFRKARDVQPWELRSLFSEAVRQPWSTARHGQTEKSLLLPAGAGPSNTGLPYFAGRFTTTTPALLAWLLAFEILGAATWLILKPLLSSLPDSGWVLSKLLGWLLLSWLSWYTAALGLLPAGAGQTRALALLLALIAGVLWMRRRTRPGARTDLCLLFAFEALFLLLFAGGALLRAANPDLWQPYFGGEKPMELAFINGILRSSQLPPYDPWFAGGYVNYYYFGQYLAAALMRLSAVGPAFGFNLAVATVFALTGSLAGLVGYSLGARIGRRAAVSTAVLTLLLVLLIGNLDGAVQMWQALRAGRLDALWLGFDFWRSTRLVPGAINEFPYFTFLYGDLHAHMIAMPMDLALLLLSATFVLHRPTLYRALGLVVLSALLLGAVAMTNPWDIPVFGGLLGVGILAWSCEGRLLPALIRLVIAGTTLLALLFMSTVPFFRAFKSFYSSVGLVKDPTPLPIFLNLLGPFLIIVSAYLLVSGDSFRPKAPWAAGAAAAVVLAWMLGHGVLVLLLVLLVLTLSAAWRERRTPVWPWLALSASGLAVWVGIELFYLKDFLEGTDAYRMNTVFKFGLQSWVLLAAGSAGLAYLLVARVPGARRRTITSGVLAVLLAASMVYPVYGTAQRLRQRFPQPPPGLTLNGEAYMGSATLANESGTVEQLGYDYAAIQWLRANVRTPDTIAEASIGPYRGNGSRVSSYTGLPAVMGWDNHESQQRYPGPVFERSRDVRDLYDTASEQRALELIEKYGVRYIYVGAVERLHELPSAAGSQPQRYASAAGLAKFNRMVGRELDVVYSNPGVVVYRVRPSWQWPQRPPSG